MRHRDEDSPLNLAGALRDWLIAITACLSIPALVYTYYGMKSARASNILAEQDIKLGLREQCSGAVCPIAIAYMCDVVLTNSASPSVQVTNTGAKCTLMI